MKKINEYNLLLYIYIFLNTFFFFYYIISGYIGGDLRVNSNHDSGILLVNYYEFILSYILIIFSFFFVSSSYLFINKFIKPSPIKSTKHIFWFFNLFFWISINIIYPPKLIDSFILKYDTLSWLYITLTQPKYLILIYIFYYSKCIHNSLIFKLNVFIYFTFMLYSGYMGYLIYLCGLLLFEYWNKLNFKKIFIYSFLFILLSPILRIIKYYFLIINSSDSAIELDDMFFMRSSTGFLDLYFNMLLTVFERFQHVSNVYFSLYSSEILKNKIDSGYTGMFYTDGWYLYFMINSLTDSLANFHEPIQATLASFIYPNVSWKSQIGLSGWFFEPVYYFFILLYALLLIIITSSFNYFLKSKSIHLLSYYLLIILLVHGWFNDYLIYIQALFIFFIFIFIKRVRI